LPGAFQKKRELLGFYAANSQRRGAMFEETITNGVQTNLVVLGKLGLFEEYFGKDVRKLKK
jgi:hypothetical protein